MFLIAIHNYELNHILAALQVWEDKLLDGDIPQYAKEIATNGGQNILLEPSDLLHLREKINFAEEATSADVRGLEIAAHAMRESRGAIAFAQVLAEGKDLLRREVEIRDKRIKELETELNRIDNFILSCQHQEHEDHLICQYCQECREDLDEDDCCPDCKEENDAEDNTASTIYECECGFTIDIITLEDEWEYEAHVQGCSLSGVEGGT